MATVLLQLPLNISRAMEEMLKQYGRDMERKNGIQLKIMGQQLCQPENIAQDADLNCWNVPDLVIGHIDYFIKRPKQHLEKNFRSLPGRFPIRQELFEAGLVDAEGYFNTFAVIPFGVFYNPDMLEEVDLPKVWEDLTQTRWHGRIAMPDKNHMAPKMLRAFMKASYPEGFGDFLQNSVYMGAPPNVVNSVDEGRYPLGITNISFARISRSKNIRLLWPQDGMFCMPLVMVWSKNADERLLEIGDFLMSRKVQEYLELQTFVPASGEIPIPSLLTDNDLSLRWKGWGNFLTDIKDLKD